MKAEDTLQYMADFYPNIFPTRKHCLNHLFCVVGNGYEWVDGELVDENDEYTKRYELRKPVKKAKFKRESEWYRMRDIYSHIKDKHGIDVYPDYDFVWYPLDKEGSQLYKYPEDITSDWNGLLEECVQMLMDDGIEF